MAERRLRTIQPAHKSENITVQQAMEAWRKVLGLPAPKAATPRPARRGANTRPSAA